MEMQKKEKLLLVDDSKFQRVVLRTMLSEYFDIIEANDGAECLEIIKNKADDIDIVLLDLVMPEVDGFEVLRRRQRMVKFREMPVIVLTTSDDISFQTEAFELGANDFIIKPVDARIAISRINNTLESVRHLKKVLEEQNSWRIKAQIDDMTHLFNKVTTEDMVTQVLCEQPKKEHALIVVDIDNFKSVNDILGHKVGDHIICVVAGVLSSLFRNTDIIGRIGGDEFVVLMRDIPDQKVVAEKAKQLVETFKYKENLTIPENISVSVGIAFSEEWDSFFAELFTKSDEALYMSKKAGKACYSIFGNEYHHVSDKNRKIILVSSSRNVASTLEYVLPGAVQINIVSEFKELKAQIELNEYDIAALYIDVSDISDNGKELWSMIQKEQWSEEYPIVAVCREGNMEQLRYAVTSEVVDDVMFAPIEASVAKRRIEEYIKKENGLK